MGEEKDIELHEHDDLEKSAVHKENIVSPMTPANEKKLIRKIDIRLVVTLGLLYCISLLDRTNMGAASIAGMQVDLHMNEKNNAYSIASLVFFITYTIFQIPATAIIRKVGPRYFISTIAFLWGAIMIAFGFVPNWQTLTGLRLILGALEAGFYPGCIFLLSTWYTRWELQKRNAGFYLIGSTASGFGGILAYGLMQLKGVGGRSGWQWIFIIEGILTCALAGLASFILVDFPEKSPQSWRFLNEEEANCIVDRIERDRSDVFVEPFSLKSYLAHAADLKVWAYCMLYLLTTTVTYSIAYFLPIILSESMHFSIAKSQCLVAPPYVAAAIVMFTEAAYADKYRIRGPIVALNAALGLLGLGLMGYLHKPGPRYFGVFLATIGGNANCPALVSWQSNNIRGQWKRAFTSATLIGGGSLGGIVATTVFRAKDAPSYHPGLLTTMLANALTLLIVGGLLIHFSRANKRAEERGEAIEGLVGFKYTL
ncbi:hypothetical protein N7456_005542 [Penicillium angulare]|uniref:Major facilitator superfamily (MFS) profile domain-containing protein n=1 Tax=Penicillium angulare TaxID=116970 RepID=A0A9W9FYP9_9EURO|nr:hypothetical protein N7456_005542 [Penicillium angulare]